MFDSVLNIIPWMIFQVTFACSKSTIETLGKGEKFVQS